MIKANLLSRNENGQIVNAISGPVSTASERHFVTIETKFYNRVGRTGAYVLTGIEFVTNTVQNQNFLAKKTELPSTPPTIGWVGGRRAYLGYILKEGP